MVMMIVVMMIRMVLHLRRLAGPSVSTTTVVSTQTSETFLPCMPLIRCTLVLSPVSESEALMVGALAGAARRSPSTSSLGRGAASCDLFF